MFKFVRPPFNIKIYDLVSKLKPSELGIFRLFVIRKNVMVLQKSTKPAYIVLSLIFSTCRFKESDIAFRVRIKNRAAL